MITSLPWVDMLCMTAMSPAAPAAPKSCGVVLKVALVSGWCLDEQSGERPPLEEGAAVVTTATGDHPLDALLAAKSLTGVRLLVEIARHHPLSQRTFTLGLRRHSSRPGAVRTARRSSTAGNLALSSACLGITEEARTPSAPWTSP
ncbi:hypothetical protein GCM10027091_39050 [Streptomyces daliensis]